MYFLNGQPSADRTQIARLLLFCSRSDNLDISSVVPYTIKTDSRPFARWLLTSSSSIDVPIVLVFSSSSVWVFMSPCVDYSTRVQWSWLQPIKMAELYLKWRLWIGDNQFLGRSTSISCTSSIVFAVSIAFSLCKQSMCEPTIFPSRLFQYHLSHM